MNVEILLVVTPLKTPTQDVGKKALGNGMMQ